MAEKPIELSRYCVPFTPYKRPLAETTVMLVSTAGVRARDDQPFNLENDTTFRAIDGKLHSRELAVDDAHYDHGCIDKDLNCVFPIDRLRELAEQKAIGGLAPRHFSMGFSQSLRELRETTIPKLAREVDAVRPDAVLLTGG